MPPCLPLLTFPRAEVHLTINTDTCGTELGCFLLRTQQVVTTRPIAYCSRTPAESEKKVTTTHKERLEAVSNIVLLRLYIEKKSIYRQNEACGT